MIWSCVTYCGGVPVEGRSSGTDQGPLSLVWNGSSRDMLGPGWSGPRSFATGRGTLDGVSS